MFIPRVNDSTRRMAVRHYAHQYTMRLVDEKIADGNVSSENSDVEDYYPLIHHSTNDTMVSASARRQTKETGWDETVRLFLSFLTFPSFFTREHSKSDKLVLSCERGWFLISFIYIIRI
ncbi:hypothetical protein ALC62_14574 [Cyphomyrmex costatus]|uniref:Uncharacterized protein n=1 Tax=Cyphomyrmex costatus TaxID=456900 RepID=A0A195C290_9HYME|nr:hypothetical protein ALC62_14574 [Cyphomyrmex costatus]